MARPLRIQYLGAIYRVISGEIGGKTSFVSQRIEFSSWKR
jgi:hypothetical protein